MVKNTTGGKGAKSKSNKKEKQREQEREAMEQNLILPKLEGDNKGTFLCKIIKVLGNGRYNLEALNRGIPYIGISRQIRMASKLKLDCIVLVAYRECNTVQKEIDILTVYSDGQVKRLAEQGYIDSEKLQNNEQERNFDGDIDSDEISEDDFDAI